MTQVSDELDLPVRVEQLTRELNAQVISVTEKDTISGN